MANTDSPRVILNDDALRERYVPLDLTAREGHVTRIRACLDSAVKGRKPTHLWLYGPSGSGKTCLARAILAKLSHDSAIRSVAVNCWERDSLYEVLDQVITELRIFRAEEHRSSVKLQRLKKCLGDRCLMILLDEVDKISPSERSRALYSLCDLGNVGLICISNDLRALYDIEDRTRSRLNPRTIAFEPYSSQQIFTILGRRAELALVPNACPDYLLKRIAAVCGGDARVAIQTLRNAAEAAEREGHESIMPCDVVAGWHDSQRIKDGQVLAGLTEDHRMLYQIASDRKAVLSTDLRQLYLQRCSRIDRRPIAPRTFSGYVSQLVRLRLLTCERARVKGNVRLLKAGK